MRRLFCVCFSFMFCTTAFSDECPKGYGYASYVVLEYIESTGTQWIDTRILPTNSTNIDIIFIDTSFKGVWSLFGTRRGSVVGTDYPATFAGFFNRTNVAINYGAKDTGFISSATYQKKQKVEIYNTGGDFYMNDVLIYRFPTTLTQNAVYTLFLFATNQGGVPDPETISYARIYEAKIYDDGVLIRDFIPVRRGGSDGEIGLYDKVESKFYGNDGSGYFIAGPSTGETVVIASDFCYPCPPNTYKDFVGGAECMPCPGPWVSPQGSTSVNDCGNVLWIGDKIFFMPSAPRTVHTLNVMDSSGNIFYGNLYSEQ